MSLLKHLMVSVSVAILAILIGTLAFSIESAREYLDGQLQSESDNAAASLALSLSQPANQDPVTRELLMMALFDGAQFKLIRLTSIEGETLFERRRPDDAPGAGRARLRAPQWFEQLLPLRVPRAQRAISDGWSQVGELTLEVETSYARAALWRSSVRMATLVLSAGAAWALFVVLLLRWFRKLLQREIEAQVQAIDNGRAAAHDGAGRPMVAELMPVVRAIAATRERVQATAMEQMARIESLELEVNCDPVTRLPNRKYFINELRRALGGASGAVAHGHVLLMRQRDLPAINAQMGRAGADGWLTTVSGQLAQVLLEHAPGSVQLARLNGSDFVVLMPALAGPQALSLVQRIQEVLLSTRVTLAGGQWCRWSYALTDYAPSSTVTGVLSRLDFGLMRSESSGQAEVEYVPFGSEEGGSGSAGETQWRELLAAALETPDALSLAVQPVALQGRRGPRQRHEASLALRTAAGETLRGALILPVAVRLGWSAEFDLRAVALGLAWLAQHPGAPLVIRISLPSVAQDDFLARLRALLQAPQWAQQLPGLCLELDAHGLIASPQEVTEFCGAMAQSKVGVGLRRLDQQPLALAQLHALALRHVKLSGDFCEEARRSPGALHLLQAMMQTAAALDIEVLVMDPLDADTARMLQAQSALMLSA